MCIINFYKSNCSLFLKLYMLHTMKSYCGTDSQQLFLFNSPILLTSLHSQTHTHIVHTHIHTQNTIAYTQLIKYIYIYAFNFTVGLIINKNAILVRFSYHLLSAPTNSIIKLIALLYISVYIQNTFPYSVSISRNEKQIIKRILTLIIVKLFCKYFDFRHIQCILYIRFTLNFIATILLPCKKNKICSSFVYV